MKAIKANLGKAPWSGAFKVKSVADAGMAKSGWNIKDTKDHLHAGGGGATKFVLYSFVSFSELVLLVEMARHIGVDLYNHDVQGGRSKFERMCDFYAGWAYNPKAHPPGKTKPGSGEGHEVDVFEIAYAFKQKPEYKRVVDRIRPAWYKGSTSGPITLTHAHGAFSPGNHTTRIARSAMPYLPVSNAIRITPRGLRFVGRLPDGRKVTEMRIGAW